MDLHNGWDYDGAGFRNSVCGSSGGIKVMFKIIAVSAALFAAPAAAQAMEPADALMGLIRMDAARQYCGLPLRRGPVTELMNVVSPYVVVSSQELAESIRRAAREMGANMQRSGALPGFCASVGEIYGRYGK